MPTIAESARALAQGKTTSVALVQEALARADDPAGEGKATYTKLYREAALAQAEASDRQRAHGIVPSPLAGIPISIKDLFDVAGETTLAGSIALRGAPPATRDAAIVARLRAAGAVIVGRTNMSEFAFSGVGINPHYGTPRTPWDRATGRVPGGSSSGAAVSVTDGMAYAGIGTDTGGSVRIPSALCGLTGLKPSQWRVPREGCFPLSNTLDSIGPLARDVADCALLDAIMAGEDPAALPGAMPLAGARLGAVQRYVLEGLDPQVAAALEVALGRLSRAGAWVTEVALGELDELPSINAGGGFPSPEAYALHRRLMAEKGDQYDPRVRSRIERGAKMSAADYIEVFEKRADLIRRVNAATGHFDALVMPTVPIVAPPVAAFGKDEDFVRLNMMLLRNPGAFNFLDRCAISLPCHTPGSAPVGLMLVGMNGADRQLLALARSVEAALRA